MFPITAIKWTGKNYVWEQKSNLKNKKQIYGNSCMSLTLSGCNKIKIHEF